MPHTTETFIKRAKEVHGDRYDYSKTIYVNSGIMVEINCKEHGLFIQHPNSHLYGHGCHKCKCNNQTLTKEQFVNKAKLIHGDVYNYDKVDYKHTKTSIIITCYKHEDFKILPARHLKGIGCRDCIVENDPLAKISTTWQFIQKAKLVHGNLYDYSFVEYQYTDKPIIIICSVHGNFRQKPHGHLSGEGCRKCGIEKRANAKRKTQESFIKEVNAVHNYYYDYSQVIYVGSWGKIKIICPKHGLFEQSPTGHLGGQGCKKCVGIISKIGDTWLDYHGIPNDKFHREVKLLDGKKYRVDGYDPKTKTVYEFDGDFWHSNLNEFNPLDIHPIIKMTHKDNYQRTLDKKRDLTEAGYKVISIWESDWKKQLIESKV